MNLLIVQLSDIHLGDKEDRNPCLARVDAICNAVQSAAVDASAVLVVSCGDTAHSGTASQYAHARRLYESILVTLTHSCQPRPVKVVVVPGNHDCNFALEDQARKILLERPNAGDYTDESPILQCLQVQRPFSQFAQEANSQNSCIQVLDSWFEQHDLDLAGQAVRIYLLNTAWASQLDEKQGHLSYPTKLLQRKLPDSEIPELVISVLHHPYCWFVSENARHLRDLLDRYSDLILTGHEHESAFYSKQRSTGEQTEYIEGGILQRGDGDPASSFNVILVDTKSGTQQSQEYVWKSEDQYYAPSGEPISRPFHRNRERLRGLFPWTEDFERWVNDPGASFHHPAKKQLVLQDIFVYPDAREVAQSESMEDTCLVRGENLAGYAAKAAGLLVIGPDGAGKTTLAKVLLSDFRSGGIFPLFLRGEDARSAKPDRITALLEQSARNQFGRSAVDPYWQLPKTKRALVLDDYHLIPLDAERRGELLANLGTRFDILVVFAGDEVRFEELTKEPNDSLALWRLKHLELLEFGYVARSKMIRQWHGLGIESRVSAGATQAEIAKIESLINMFLGEQFMPAYPIFILAALQQFDVQDRVAVTSSSMGYLYEALILRNLADSATKQTDIDTNKNYLTELAYWLFDRNMVRISLADARDWHSKYCAEYRLAFDFDGHQKALVESGLLVEHSGLLSFRYPYLYYYFVANYFSQNVSKPDIRRQFRVLCTYLHQSDAANIVLFMCHLSRDPLVLDSVMETADQLFKRYAPCDLDADVRFLNKSTSAMPDRQLGDGDPERNRQKLLEHTDEQNRANQEPKDYALATPVKHDSICELDTLNDQLQLTAALKTIQIIGQILRNHVGSLRGDTKQSLVTKSYLLGLRAMKCLFDVMEDNAKDLVDSLVVELQRKHGGTPRHKHVESANRSVWGILELGTFSIIKYISGSVGLEKLEQTFREVLDIEGSVPFSLIDLSVKLDHYRSFPERETLTLAGTLCKNVFTFSVLRDLVWNHFYIFHADYQIRQRISEKLRISPTGQKKLIGSRAKRLKGPGQGKGGRW
jgi:hypothetical protein